MSFEKIVVIDTNVLLHNPMAFTSFKDCVVAIPILILEELDSFKIERGSLGRNARLTTKILEKISTMGDLSTGVRINNQNSKFLGKVEAEFDCIVKIFSVEKCSKLEKEFSLDTVDNSLLSFCRDLNSQGKTVSLVTRDINLRLKARSINLTAIEYDKCPIENEEYKGWKEFFVDTYELNALEEKDLESKFALENFRPNEYLLVRSNDNPDKYRIFRYFKNKEKNGFQEIEYGPDLWGFLPKNALQEIAFDLILDDSISLVFLMGPAGTGKTLITLLSGLYKVVVERNYQKFFIARPLVSLGADIGFIPGDLQEKLFHWMHPFYDNFEYIFQQMSMKGEDFHIPHFESEFKNKQKRSFRSSHRQGRGYSDEAGLNFDPRVHENVTTLKNRGFLSLEAITHMRGRSLPGQFMFIDEAQNLSPEETKTIITRAGKGTKIILAGDPYQIDSPNLDFYNNGLVTSSIKLRGQDIVGQVFLDTGERSPLAKLAIEKL